MNMSYRNIIRKASRSLEPQLTDVRPNLASFSDVKAILFDVYGTMLISGSGDVGTAQTQDHDRLLRDALAAAGLADEIEHNRGSFLLRQAIDQSHAAARANGIAYPEVDIESVWRTALSQLAQEAGWSPKDVAAVDIRRLAIEYETRTNPCWPMPGLANCLADLRRRGLRLGIVSNAQFYTRELFPALLDQTLEELGFDPSLQYFSYEFGQAKPDAFLYRQAAEQLAQSEVSPREVIYIGNDMLNDIVPASQVGFRTVLFAGDSRSLRWRADDPRIGSIKPDAIMTNLSQLTECLS
jgi:putative hydrolase of the HAD superfamily